MRISRDQSGSRSQLAAIWHHRPFSMGSFYNLVTPFIRYVRSVNLIFRNTEQNPSASPDIWTVICNFESLHHRTCQQRKQHFKLICFQRHCIFIQPLVLFSEKKKHNQTFRDFLGPSGGKKTCNVLCSVKIQTSYELIISGRGGAPPLMQCCVQHTSPSAQQLFHFHHRVGRVPSPSLLCCNTYNLDRWKNIKICKDNVMYLSLSGPSV